MQVGLPALSGLKASRLASAAPVGAPTRYGDADDKPSPWELTFEQKVVPSRTDGTLAQVIMITVAEGPVHRQELIKEALNEKFNRAMKMTGMVAGPNSGRLFTTCSDHSLSTIKWEFSKAYNGMMPPNGIPPTTAMPGGSVFEFLRLALGQPPVTLAAQRYTYEATPGKMASITQEEWLLKQVDEQERVSWYQLIQRAQSGARR